MKKGMKNTFTINPANTESAEDLLVKMHTIAVYQQKHFVKCILFHIELFNFVCHSAQLQCCGNQVMS